MTESEQRPLKDSEKIELHLQEGLEAEPVLPQAIAPINSATSKPIPPLWHWHWRLLLFVLNTYIFSSWIWLLSLVGESVFEKYPNSFHQAIVLYLEGVWIIMLQSAGRVLTTGIWWLFDLGDSYWDAVFFTGCLITLVVVPIHVYAVIRNPSLSALRKSIWIAFIGFTTFAGVPIALFAYWYRYLRFSESDVKR